MITTETRATLGSIVDFSSLTASIANYMQAEVQKTLEMGGRPAWPLTRAGKMADYGGKLRDNVEKSSDKNSARVWVETSKVPYAALVQYGHLQVMTEGQKKFMWAKWYETGEEKWKWMALSLFGVLIYPERPYMQFLPENIEWINQMIPLEFVKLFNANQQEVTA
jgi:phage gpG-like protein